MMPIVYLSVFKSPHRDGEKIPPLLSLGHCS
jgi:hypothetical protein